MASTNLRVRSGNRIIVEIDGTPVGLLQSVRASDDYSPEAASGIGDIHVQEYVPTQARHMLSVSAMVLKIGSLRSLGVIPENGDAVLRGLIFDFVQYDKDTGQPIRKYSGCSYASGDYDVTKHAIVMESAQFNALNATGTGL